MKNSVLLALNGDLRGNKADYNFIDDYIPLLEENRETKAKVSQQNNIIAADGGALFLEKIGLFPDVVIGDLDSLTDEKCDFYRSQDVKIIKFPRAKDKTDGELALDYCRQNDREQVLIIGAAGGRLDQQLGNISLLEYALKLGIKARIREPEMEIGLISKGKVFENSSGALLSLVPMTEKVTGVELNGCRYDLDNEALFRYRNRGISNKITANQATVKIDDGLLLYMKGYRNKE